MTRSAVKHAARAKAAPTRKASPARKIVYFFGGGKADGTAKMKELLGGKGANLAEMAGLGLPVPPGFTITTGVCTYYYEHGRKLPATLSSDVEKNLRRIETILGAEFGDAQNPLLVSVRSGARSSMPGMMETILNVGLNDVTREGLVAKTGNARFVYDAQRRLIQMYSDVVMEKAAGIEPAPGKGIRQQLERELERLKESRGVRQDTELSADDLRALIDVYKSKVLEVLGRPFPEDPREQLWGGIGAVFQSWNGRRAVEYRRIEKIPDEWGTAVSVQAMVFGNMGETSATGVGFTRNPATGENIFYGEWLPTAQGEDVVAGIRTPLPINEAGKTEHTRHLPSLETAMPDAYRRLARIQRRLERHSRDMLDSEFTSQEGRLWMLQCRVGKRNGVAAVKMAVDMANEKLIAKREAVLRVSPSALVQVLLPMLDPKAELETVAIAKGLPAGPGGAYGRIALTADEAAAIAAQKSGEDAKVVLVREETSPEDIHGMHAAQAILTAKGGMTSHAALVARGWGKCCIVGCDALEIDLEAGTVQVGSRTLRRGDWISLNGTEGKLYEGRIALVAPNLEHNREYRSLMRWADRFRRLGIRANADTVEDAARARAFGAEGIGLFRTEHMFYGEGSDAPLGKLRRMIVAESESERRAALAELFVDVKSDILATLEVMQGLPVTIRLLDPPLHEFVPKQREKLEELAAQVGIDIDELERRAAALHETNPMMGHRGVRLGISYPEVTEMQVRAIFEAAAELLRQGKKAEPEIMIPVVSAPAELDHQYAIIERVYGEVLRRTGLKRIPHLVGTMIEVPRAALLAGKIAERARFFSFGTNDLTQLTFGFSRDDTGSFLPRYLAQKLLPEDPFASLDESGVGELVKVAIERGRRTRRDLKIGICGEHGGDPRSVAFCHDAGLDYVSCSPFRVPIARLAAAHAALQR
ncbi:MAG: pyruvate, phosphate dikinase [Deltaproteobacteria bacterium]|nr:pyruvate, phosphate dikinase [Deltaproteobacteria bacterium]